MSSSSDSEGEDSRYQPVLAERIRSTAGPNSPALGSSSGRQWPKDGVNVYHNELFTDGENGENGANGLHPRPPGSAQKMQQQKSSLAARRAERMQANIYQSNDAGMARTGLGSPGPRHPAYPGAQGYGSRGGAEQDYGSHQQYRSTPGGSNVYGLASTFDPNEEDGDGTHTHSMQRQQIQQVAAPQRRLDIGDLPTFLMQPGPMNGPVMCYIVRDKGSAKMYPKYNLYLEDGKRFLLAARKRKKQTTSNYLMSLDPDDLDRESSKYFGKLRANFVGTEFTIFDGGSKPGRSKGPDGSREELGCVTYQYNVLGTRGPRKMTGVIPAVDASGQRLFNPTSEHDTMLERIRTNRGLDELVIMRNKPPRWNDELNAYCLNFSGRVTEASVKNFQLVTDDNQNHVILQFGKIGKNTFTMDYQWPISAFQAFAICLSSFDNKLACE